MTDKERLEKYEKAIKELEERYKREKKWAHHLGEYGDHSTYKILESVINDFKF